MADGAIATGLKVVDFVNVFRKATSMDFAKALTLEAPDLKVMIDRVKDDMLAKKYEQQHEAVDDAVDQVLRGTQLLEDEPQDPSAAADATGQTSALVLATALCAPKAAATAAGPAAATAGPAAATAERATAAENAEQQETKQPKEGNHDHDDRKKFNADRQAWRRLVKQR